VLDEPLSALDTSVQAHVLNLLAELQRRLALTMVFISHDLAAVRWACDRTVVMYLGRVVENAPTAQLFERPRHPYTQALLAATPRGDPALPRVRPALRGEPGGASTGGCDFAPRCPFVAPQCFLQRPVLESVGSAGAQPHRAACLRLNDVPIATSQESACP
jgi:peptide/nickel transport system ATP-binding protein